MYRDCFLWLLHFELKFSFPLSIFGATHHNMAREKGMSCRRLYVELAKRSPMKMTVVEVLEFLRVLSEVTAKNMAPQNVIQIPQLATFRIRFNNPRPEHTKRIGRAPQSLLFKHFSHASFPSLHQT